MTFAADLHLHSRWSRATSRSADLDGYREWALVKGLSLLAAGDFTHPKWRSELEERLVERDGLYEIAAPRPTVALEGARPADRPVRFILITEISSIYRKAGSTRKVHSLVGVPNLEAARRLAARLAAIGNVASDGRPILGLDPKDLLSMVLEVSPEAFLIPAHIWTPWFSIFGSRSGFDRIEDCFEELTPRIFALETGLSSDVAMNRRWSALDRFRLISCSDAHSPGNLGREATLFDTELSWPAVVGALRTGAGYRGTLEFYPEEGKYHYDGHRRCGVRQDPAETLRRGAACPVCGKALTVGVLNRLLTLCDRDAPLPPADGQRPRYLVPLPELLSEILATGPGSRAVTQLYARIVSTFGSEYAALTEAPLEEIARAFGVIVGESIRRVREGRVNAEAGFDGEFGVIRVFTDSERRTLAGEEELFALAPARRRRRPSADRERVESPGPSPTPPPSAPSAPSLDPEQATVVEAAERAILVRAGPGAGKTRTLTEWVARQITSGGVPGREVVAITFTNRAAAEMRERLAVMLGERADPVTVATFHSFCWRLVQDREPARAIVYGPRERESFLGLLLAADEGAEGRAAELSQRIGRVLEGVEEPDPALAGLIARYRSGLDSVGASDLSGLIGDVLGFMRADPEYLPSLRRRIRCLAVDELQDVNRQQYDLLRLLAGDRVLAIGDPNQAIYGFRGSDASLFERFGREVAARTFFLGRNHRSSATIARAASALIGSGLPDAGKPAGETPGPRVRIHHARDPDREAGFIASSIEELVGGTDHVSASEQREGAGGWAFSDIAVLFRTRAVRDALLPELERAAIPFTVREASPLATRGPCAVAVAALRLLADPRDPVALADVLGGTSAGLPRSVRAALAASPPRAVLDTLGESAGPGGLGLARRLLAERDALLERIDSQGIEPLLAELLGAREQPAEAGLEGDLLLETAREHGADLAAFLRRLALSTSESEGGVRSGKLRLLTFHAAKGLEFPVVFIAGAEEGITPILDRGGAAAEEERRLFYVAMTRAKTLLAISCCGTRWLHGGRSAQAPSRFLAELPEDCVQEVRPGSRRRAAADQLRLF